MSPARKLELLSLLLAHGRATRDARDAVVQRWSEATDADAPHVALSFNEAATTHAALKVAEMVNQELINFLTGEDTKHEG